jgi:HlyD family secretion protein
MAARVSFLSAPLDAAAMKEPPKVVLPASAVTERGGSKVVFRIEDGRARMVPVALGPPVGSGFEVVTGPKEGARLVANPSPALADGDTIKEKSR